MPTVKIPVFKWSAEPRFIGRQNSLAELERWWADENADPINLYGRRRVGKSWLIRKFAHGKKAIVLVVEKTTRSQQLMKLAEQLTSYLGFTPAIKDIGELVRILYGLTASEEILVVIDEFPYLLGTSAAEVNSSLHVVAKVIEDMRDDSMIKLILCGSALAEMESMQEHSSPLFGRLQKFELKPLTFAESRPFFKGSDVLDHLTRYSVAGGMPRYLSLLGGGDLARVLSEKIVNPNSPLYSEVTSLLEAELIQPGVYFAILAELAVSPKEIGDIADAIGQESNSLGTYLRRLEAMRIIKKKQPVGSDPKSRTYQWECIDGFIRFWFRYVWPYRAGLESGADSQAHVNQHIMPMLAEHTSLEFERVFQRWVIQKYPSSPLVGNWWGKAVPVSTPVEGAVRSKEEIDVVGIKGRKVFILGEAKWKNGKLKVAVVNDLINHKEPALLAAGFTIAPSRLVLLTSRGGFTRDVKRMASEDSRILLLDAATVLTEVR